VMPLVSLSLSVGAAGFSFPGSITSLSESATFTVAAGSPGGWLSSRLPFTFTFPFSSSFFTFFFLGGSPATGVGVCWPAPWLAPGYNGVTGKTPAPCSPYPEKKDWSWGPGSGGPATCPCCAASISAVGGRARHLSTRDEDQERERKESQWWDTGVWDVERREEKGKEGKGREGKGREGKGREGKGREGKGVRRWTVRYLRSKVLLHRLQATIS